MAIPILGNEFWMSPTMGGVNSSTAVGLMAQQGAELSKKIEIDSQKNEAKAKAPAIGQIYQQAYERIASGDTGGFADLSLAGAMTTGNPFLMAMHKDVTDVAGHLSQQFMQRSLDEESRKFREKMFNMKTGADSAMAGAAAAEDEHQADEKYNREIESNYAELDSKWVAGVKEGLIDPNREPRPVRPTVENGMLKQPRAGGDFSPPFFGDTGLPIPKASAVEPPLPSADPLNAQAPANSPVTSSKLEHPQVKPVEGEEAASGYDFAYNPDKIVKVVVKNPTTAGGVSKSVTYGGVRRTTTPSKGETKAGLEDVHTAVSELSQNNSDELNWIYEQGKDDKTNTAGDKVKFSDRPVGGEDQYEMKYGNKLYSKKVYVGKKHGELSEREYNKQSKANTLPQDTWTETNKAEYVTDAFRKRHAIFKEAVAKKQVSFIEVDNTRPIKTKEEALDFSDDLINQVASGAMNLADANMALEANAGNIVMKITEEAIVGKRKEMKAASMDKEAEQLLSGRTKPGQQEETKEKKQSVKDFEKQIVRLKKEYSEAARKLENIPDAPIHFDRAKKHQSRMLAIAEEIKEIESEIQKLGGKEVQGSSMTGSLLDLYGPLR